MKPFDFFFPPACVGCEARGEWLCDECWLTLVPTILKDHRFMILDDPYGGEKLELITVCRPSTILQRVIHEFKYTYHDDFYVLLGELITARIQNFCHSISEKFSTDKVFLAPVPLHESRMKMRGFNQSELLSRYISDRVGWPVWNGLVRVRATAAQATLSRHDRLSNIEDAFGVCVACPIPDIVFIVDDVVTTGATFSECRRILLEAGVKEIYGIVLSHGL